MACKTEERTIRMGGEDRKVTITQMSAEKGYRLSNHLLRIAGPALATLFGGDAAQLGPAVSQLLANLTDEEFDRLLREMVFEPGCRLEVRREGEGVMLPIKDVFKSEFAGEIGAIYALLGQALVVNFGNFTEGLAGLFPPGLLAKLAKLAASNPSITSAGLSKG